MSKLTAAYLAGLIDGEGHISIIPYVRKDRNNQVYYKHNVKMTLTDKHLIEWCKASFGGYIYVRTQTNPKWKDSYTWSLNSKGTEELLRYIHPYLRLKKRQCGLVLERFRISKHRRIDQGISYVKEINKWRAYIYLSGKQTNLGCFTQKEDALKAYSDALLKENPKFVPAIPQDNKRVEEIYNELRKLNQRGPSLYAERLSEMTSKEEAIV